MTTSVSYIRHPHNATAASLTPRQVAAAYNFPINRATGKGYTGGIIELGGGFSVAQIAKYFSQNGLPTPTFVSKPVAGGKNKSDGINGADGEVQLDMIVSGAVALGATFNVYFAPNTNAGFLEAIKAALADGCNGISISWGSAEGNWDAATMDQFEAVFKAARAAGVPVFVAAGDSGSKDSTSTNQTDFPASSPSAIGCGGTRLILNADGTRASETVWDDNDTQSATGGGVSKHFPGRTVPDIAGNADPDSGYQIMVDGQSMVIGGTSAVAPLMLGLHALLWELLSGKSFDLINTITSNPNVCFDVTLGDNGGFRAGPGRDDTTGFGVPDGARLLALLEETSAPVPTPTPAPAPTPAPTPVPVPSPMDDFPVVAVNTWLEHKHNHSASELAAAKALVAWATANGIELASA